VLGDVDEDTEDECDEVGGSDEKIGLEEALVVCNCMQKLCIDTDTDGVSLLEVQKQL
jgi:hypothetical protein